jgi:hypothetical protein
VTGLIVKPAQIADVALVKVLARLLPETVLEVEATVAESEQAPGGVELRAKPAVLQADDGGRLRAGLRGRAGFPLPRDLHRLTP